MRYPKFLQTNGSIGFIAPSFGCKATEPYKTFFANTTEKFESMGYTTEVGPNVYCDCGIGKSNTPEKCAEEINDFFCNSKADVIISAGGGETMCEDLEYVDFDGIASATPHWFLGFSDNTNLTFTLPTLCDTAAIYGPNAPKFGVPGPHPYISDTFDMLCGKKLTVFNYKKFELESLRTEENPFAPMNDVEPFRLSAYIDGTFYGPKVPECYPNAKGIDGLSQEFHGRLLGGCLDCLVNLVGTRFDHVKEFNGRYNKDGIIWFFEACELNVFAIRRALWQMDNAGWFENARGFLVGRPCHFNEEFGPLNRFNAVTDILGKYKVPIIMDLDIGHLPPQMPLISGARADINVTGNFISVAHSLT